MMSDVTQTFLDKFQKTDISISQLRSGIKSFKTQAEKEGFATWISGDSTFGGMQVDGVFQFKLAQDGAKRAKLSSTKTEKGKAGLIPSLYIVPMLDGKYVSTSGKNLNSPSETLQGGIPDSWLSIWEKDPSAVITAEVKKSGDYYNVQKAQSANQTTTTIKEEVDEMFQ